MNKKHLVLGLIFILNSLFTILYAKILQIKTKQFSENDSVFKIEVENIKEKLRQKVILNKDEINLLISFTPLSNEEFNVLSIDEKIIYTLDFPESHTYSCSVVQSKYPIFDTTLYLFSDFKSISNVLFEYVLSPRQVDFIDSSKDKIIHFLKRYLALNDTKKIDDNYKKIIANRLNTLSLTPEIIKLAKSSDDSYLLTTLMLLMKKNRFTEFINSKIYKSLYLKNKQSINKIKLTPAIKTNILTMTKHFYSQKK